MTPATGVTTAPLQVYAMAGAHTATDASVRHTTNGPKVVRWGRWTRGILAAATGVPFADHAAREVFRPVGRLLFGGAGVTALS